MSDRNAVYDSSAFHLDCQLFRCPVADRKATVFRIFATDRDNLRDLLCRELRFHTRPVEIRKHERGECFQFLIRRAIGFCLLQTLLDLEPSSSPPTDTLRINTQLLGRRPIEQPFRRSQDDTNPFGQLLRSRGGARLRFEDATHSG